MVCTALSTAGGFITDLKIGYWIGTTPKKQESWKFLGVFVSAATVAGVMIILNKTYGFGPGSPLEAPQANAMAAERLPGYSISAAQSSRWYSPASVFRPFHSHWACSCPCSSIFRC